MNSFAFAVNDLTSITIPNSLTEISMGAFYSNKLVNVTIPAKVTTIDKKAFGCFILWRGNYEFDEQSGTIIKYVGFSKNIVIPSDINGVTVTA